MARISVGKLKILYIMKILLEQTDDEHAVSLQQITDYLQSMGINAERKAIYDDINTLKAFGLDIEMRGGKSWEYYIANRDFQFPELKLLVDTVQSSRFITQKKSGELIKKLEALCSDWQARELNRDITVANRVKTMNENIYYNTDALYKAMIDKKTVSFKYLEHKLSPGNGKVTEVCKHNGKIYEVSPWALTWNEGNYYLIGFDSVDGIVKHYRVDKIKNLDTLDKPQAGKKERKSFDAVKYTQEVFGMFGGEESKVCLEFDEELLGVVIDRFGKSTHVSAFGNKKFRVTVTPRLSPLFYSWLFNFGTGVKVISPKAVADEYAKRAKAVAELYG